MTFGRKTGGRDFPKGKPGGPGRTAYPPEFKEFRKRLQGDYEKIVERVWKTPVNELKAQLKAVNEGTLKLSAAEVWLMTMFVKGINGGDYLRMDSLMNRIAGKPKERVEVSGPDGGPQTYRELPDEDLDDQVRELQQQLAELRRDPAGMRPEAAPQTNPEEGTEE